MQEKRMSLHYLRTSNSERRTKIISPLIIPCLADLLVFLAPGLYRQSKRRNMKPLILSAVLVAGLAAGASAQTHKSTAPATKARKDTVTPKVLKGKQPSQVLNNRKIYHFQDGQRSTPTGHEATPVNGGYAALGKDSTPVKRKKH